MSLAADIGWIPSRVAIEAIRLYQRRLSPLKGYRCAHRILHRGDSCSEHARRGIATDGVFRGLQQLRSRFGECREACRILKARRLLFAMSDGLDVVTDEPSSDEFKSHRRRGANGCDLLYTFPTDLVGDACVGLGCDIAGGADCVGCVEVGACL